MDINLFGYKVSIGKKEDEFYSEMERAEDPNYGGDNRTVNEGTDESEIKEESVKINEDLSSFDQGKILEIKEEAELSSPGDIRKMIDKNEASMANLIEALRSDYSYAEVFKENEEMSRDPLVGSAMELMADDASLRDPATGTQVTVTSGDDDLAEFLNTFLQENIKIERRLWEWTYEVVKHGDLKLRRREYIVKNKKGSNEAKDVESSENKPYKGVYYENVIEGWKVSRIEYLGEVLGYMDEDEEEGGDGRTLRSPDDFVHFVDIKLPKRKKVKVRVSAENKDGEMETKEIICSKVYGSSVIDNARYIFRVVRLLDDMLIMSRIARSSQFNLVKVEVGDASPSMTQQILMDVRRRLEGSTRMQKGKGIRTDPSPIPVSSNVYIPVRQGKGDVQVDSQGDNVDVRHITDIDYFKNKEFATLRTPKAFLGFEDEMPGTMGNASLLRMDIRYSRTIQRVQNILRNGLEELCNNYLRYRGRGADVGNFEIEMRDVTHTEDDAMLNELMQRLSLVESVSRFASDNSSFIDMPSMLNHVLTMVGLDVTKFAKGDLLKLIKGEYEPPTEVEDTDDDAW